MQAPAVGVLLEPAAQPRPLAQERLVRDLDRAIADGQQAAVREHGERPADVVVAGASSSASGTRRAREPPSPSPASRSRSGARPPAASASKRRRRPRRGVPPRPERRPFGHRPPAAGAGPALPPQFQQGGGEQRQRARLPSTSATRASSSSGSTPSPARAAGRAIARRSSSRDIGPTSAWLRRPGARARGMRPASVKVGPQREHDHGAALAVRRGATSAATNARVVARRDTR